MAMAKIYYATMNIDSTIMKVSDSYTINTQADEDLLALCYLTSFETSPPWYIYSASIINYKRHNEYHQGPVQFLFGKGFTEITFVVEVSPGPELGGFPPEVPPLRAEGLGIVQVL